MHCMKYIAFVTKGIEEIAKMEIERLLSDGVIHDVGGKRIVFETEKSELVIKLRTVDDLCVFAHQKEGIVQLDQIVGSIEDIDFGTLKKTINQLRPVTDTFSLTISIAGSPIKATDVSQTLSKRIAEKYQWTFTERDHTNFDIRVFIDHKTVIIGVRLTPESLHHRAYKQFEKPGSLRPTVAAAMTQLAISHLVIPDPIGDPYRDSRFRRNDNLAIVDNFCGSGTILCEAVAEGNSVFGGDIDEESVENTKKSLKNLNYDGVGKIVELNAMQSSWKGEMFDVAISNLPWDKQIKVLSITSLYENSIREYARILNPNGVLCLLVSKPDLCVKYMKRFLPEKKIEQYKIGLLGENPTIVVAF